MGFAFALDVIISSLFSGHLVSGVGTSSAVLYVMGKTSIHLLLFDFALDVIRSFLLVEMLVSGVGTSATVLLSAVLYVVGKTSMYL